ncbi:MAG: helix-turn-helix transcriptional regulator [Pseudomonadota bacterium]|jgi:HTH-type transcriptional regulator/antitoxin HipB
MQFPLQTIDQLKPLVQGFRKRAGLTQAAMAEKLGITQQSYAQMESNLGSTSVERLYTIMRLLDVQLSFLPSDGEVPTKPSKANKIKSAMTGPGPQEVKQSDKTKW